ncbi:molybdenum cofactor guanylyltransferase MobA [Vibrio hannami]|uniref:molybdenum cofactor guanylyltransferase MobA n=1 Tax=Vibrio hannami TaxID=2717094 RepID=UPI00240EF08D|nr:molybdenum cofactor guanylyltransferase MobA [Vibrio hannami]MDG3088152.1 molybdenum cofactor guanylyltransferase MobA [Vibrio hannami]
MKNKNQLSWTILAGGEAKRMGGSDKGLVSFNDKPLIEYVYNALKHQVHSITISANRNIDDYQKYSPVIRDERKGFQGPLAGIEVALKHSETIWTGFAPCDSPNLPNDLVARLTHELSPDVDIYVAIVGSKVQPVFSVWNKRTLAKLTQYLENGDRKIMLFFDNCNTVYIDFSDIPHAFANLNSPEDVTKLGNKYE